jgi:replication factor C large subunit
MTDSRMWADKHRPETFSEIQGNTAAIEGNDNNYGLKEWATDFPDDRTPRMLVGPPGTGKTVTVEVIADWLDLQMVEINASSARKTADIEDLAATIGGTNIDGERRVILVDEVDSWHWAANKRPLYDALEAPPNLVFLTANDEWEVPSGIRKRVEEVDFKLTKRSRLAKLKKIRDAEGVDIDDAVLDDLAERPDLRSAINDLQVFSVQAIDGEVPEDARSWDKSEWDMVDDAMTGTPDLGQHEDDLHSTLIWLDENLGKDWRGLELAWGYEALSMVDQTMMLNTDIAKTMAADIAHLRLTEPYYDDHIGRKKEFPEWFRAKRPKATRESPAAKLYRALSNFENGEPGLHMGYHRFREIHLPRLKDLSDEEKYRLILQRRLSTEEYEELDVQQREYEAWLEEESPESGEDLARTQPADAW